MRHLLIRCFLATGAQAFAPAPIRWGSPTRKFVLAPKAFLNVNAALVPQDLAILDRPGLSPDVIPHFTAKLDNTIVWDARGWCLDASGYKDGSVVRVNHCTGGSAQKWSWLPNGHGQDMIQLMDTSKCLDVSATEGSLNGALVQLRECNGNSAALWNFEASFPSLNQGEAPSSSVPHLALSLTSMAALAVLSLGTWLVRSHAYARMAAARHNGGQRGVSMATPLSGQGVVPVVMAVSPMPNDTPDDAAQSPMNSTRQIMAACAATLVLDCGSTGTRGKFYSSDGNGRINMVPWTVSERNVLLPAIAEVLASGDSAIASFLDQLVEELSACRITPNAVVLGATGGLREALETGAVMPATIGEFERALCRKDGLPDAVTFEVLSGEEEARCEHESVMYLAKQVLPAEGGAICMMSSGGMTTQLAYYPDSSKPDVKVLSLLTKTKFSYDILLEKGVEASLIWFENQLEQLIPDTGLVGKLDGTFAAIEMLGMLGEYAGIAHRIVSREDAHVAIIRHLDAWKAKYKGVNISEAGCSWRDVLVGPLSVLALHLISLLSPSATLYFANHWQLTPTETLKPAWPLGLYLRRSSNGIKDYCDLIV